MLVLNTGTLVLFAPLWPLIAVSCALWSYVRHLRVVEAGRRVHAVLYVLAAVLCGVLFGVLGIFGGIRWACAGSNPGNLCGLTGFLVTGPIAGSGGIILVALALSLVRPDRRSSIGRTR